MQSFSSRIWTRVAVSISYDDNHYTTNNGWYAMKPNQDLEIWEDLMLQSSTLATILY